MFLRFFRKGIPLFMAAFSSQLICAEKKKNIKTQTYLWGNGVYQARPDALLQFHNFTLKKSGIYQIILFTWSSENTTKQALMRMGVYVWLAQELDANLE